MSNDPAPSGTGSQKQRNASVGQVDLLAENGFFSYEKTAGKQDRYQYRQAKLKGSVAGDQALADIALELKDGGVLTSKVSAVVSSLDKKPIFTAEGSVEALPLELAQAYLPAETRVQN